MKNGFFSEIDMLNASQGGSLRFQKSKEGEWITHILGSLVGAIEAAKVTPSPGLSRNWRKGSHDLRWDTENSVFPQTERGDIMSKGNDKRGQKPPTRPSSVPPLRKSRETTKEGIQKVLKVTNTDPPPPRPGAPSPGEKK